MGEEGTIAQNRVQGGSKAEGEGDAGTLGLMSHNARVGATGVNVFMQNGVSKTKKTGKNATRQGWGSQGERPRGVQFTAKPVNRGKREA